MTLDSQPLDVVAAIVTELTMSKRQISKFQTPNKSQCPMNGERMPSWDLVVRIFLAFGRLAFEIFPGRLANVRPLAAGRS
jgi:hypothetical protein